MILSLFLPNLLWSQSKSDMDEIISSLENKKSHYNNTQGVQEQKYINEYQLLFSEGFRFYKNYISSQDASQCSFTPSCSEYAITAIQNQGIFIGLLNFFDRFLRCNSLSPENYIKDPQNHLLVDPVRNIHYEKI